MWKMGFSNVFRSSPNLASLLSGRKGFRAMQYLHTHGESMHGLNQLCNANALILLRTEQMLRDPISRFILQSRLDSGIPEADIPFDADRDLMDIRSSYDLSNGRFIVISNTQFRIVATGALYRLDARTAEIRKFYVSSTLSGIGLGRTMLKALLSEARRLRYTSVQLKTFPHLLGAIRVYAGEGFVRSEKRLVEEPKVLVYEKRFDIPRCGRVGLSRSRTVSKSRAVELVQAVYEDPDIRSGLNRWVETLGGTQSARMWDQYFQSYDKIVAFSDGYRELVARTDAAVARSGTIVDYGGGTGNFSAALKFSAPRRFIVLLDLSPNGVRIAEEKLSAASGEAQRGYRVERSDLRGLAPSFQGKVSGAILNNVFYTLEPSARVDVLKKIYSDLKPGGRLILNDPKPIAQSPDDLRDFLIEVVRSAAGNQAPMSEFDVAVVSIINQAILTAKAPPFIANNELVLLAGSLGFEILEGTSAYYNRVTSWVLQKPRRVTRASRFSLFG